MHFDRSMSKRDARILLSAVRSPSMTKQSTGQTLSQAWQTMQSSPTLNRWPRTRSPITSAGASGYCRVIAAAHNQPISSSDPTAHAEIVALRDAGRAIGNYRLTGASLYVTVEPCLMCVGAMIHARISEVVFGAPEPKAGALESTQRAHEHAALNHRLRVVSGVLAGECAELMRGFFERRRVSP